LSQLNIIFDLLDYYPLKKQTGVFSPLAYMDIAR